MKTDKLELGGSCHLEATRWDSFPTQVSIEYVEHATDHWNSDSTTSVDIDADMARKIIAFLSAAHGIGVA